MANKKVTVIGAGGDNISLPHILDAYGNEVHEGDYVTCTQIPTISLAKIISIKEGGLSLTGSDPRLKTPTHIRIIVDLNIDIPAQPGVRVGLLIKANLPDAEMQRLAELACSETKH
jgi:hypothetical protein